MKIDMSFIILVIVLLIGSYNMGHSNGYSKAMKFSTDSLKEIITDNRLIEEGL